MPGPDSLAADLAAMDAAIAGRPHAGGDPALAELAVMVREVRPLPDAAVARRLDSRAATALRAPASKNRWRRPMWLMAALGACASIALIVVALQLATGDRDVAPTSGGSAGGGSSAASREAAPASRGPSGASSGGAGGGTVTPGRAVERSASMRIVTRPGRIDEVASGAARVATGLGGYVASSSVTSGRAADLDLRVPSARVDQAVERLSQLGRVHDLQRSTLDITDELTNARRRVQEDRAARRSLLRRLARAATRGQEERIRARLAAATRRLDRARAAVARLRSRASYASISVTVVGERGHGAAGGGGSWTPGNALYDALRVLEVAAGVILVALAVMIPLGAIGLAAWIASRRLARRRREHALDFA